MEEFKFPIVVVSRARAHRMRRILSLLPTAIVVIDEREEAHYAPHVPKSQLITREPIKNCTCANAKNWVLDNFTEDCIVFIDDDFKGVNVLVGDKKTIKSPDKIYTIIENAAWCCRDLGLGVFCWSRSANTFLLKTELKPFRPVMPVSSSFGVMGPARSRRLDVTLPGRADADFTMQCLLHDRLPFMDGRFYFDHGRVFSGRGGNVGMITGEAYAESGKDLKAKWGKHLNFNKPGFDKKRNQNTDAFSIRVKRTNPTVID